MNFKFTYVFGWILACLALTSCKEIGPQIDLIQPERKVLIEEFSGVQCVNCPEGADKLELLLDLYDENLIAVSIHSGFFAMPHSTSQLDFRTPEGTFLDDMLGPVTFYPSASVNRKEFVGENGVIVNSTKWAGLILQELARPSPVQLEVTSEYDNQSRELNINTNIIFFEDQSDHVSLTVLIKESNIVDSQLAPGGLNENYNHLHVLRKVLTAFGGDPISDATVAAAPIQNNFSLTLPPEWKEFDCSVIAFISNSSPVFDVLQAEEILVVE